MKNRNDHDSPVSDSITNGVGIPDHRCLPDIPNLDGVSIRLFGNLVEGLPDLRREVVTLPGPFTVVPNGRLIVFHLGDGSESDW